jgi:hypothetical protein
LKVTPGTYVGVADAEAERVVDHSEVNVRESDEPDDRARVGDDVDNEDTEERGGEEAEKPEMNEDVVLPLAVAVADEVNVEGGGTKRGAVEKEDDGPSDDASGAELVVVACRLPFRSSRRIGGGEGTLRVHFRPDPSFASSTGRAFPSPSGDIPSSSPAFWKPRRPYRSFRHQLLGPATGASWLTSISSTSSMLRKDADITPSSPDRVVLIWRGLCMARSKLKGGRV